MPFNKLDPAFKETLSQLGLELPTSFQQQAIPKLKSGLDFMGIAPVNSGKTCALIINIIHKLNHRADGNAPRAVVLVKNKESVFTLYNQFEAFTKFTDLRLYMGYEGLHIDIQKSEIFMGIDILITTPKNLLNLFLFNGASTAMIKVFALDDAHLFVERQELTALSTVNGGLKKCQKIILANVINAKLQRLQETLLVNANYVEA